MAEETGIEWCDSTFNPWIGCTKVSPGCDHCYAEVSTPARTQHIGWGARADRKRTGGANWAKPIAWNNAALSFELEHGRRRRVFCASLADVFDNQVPVQWRLDLWALIDATPKLDWLILTKRIGNVPAWVELHGWPANARIGASMVSREEMVRDIPKLRAIPAPNFISAEPLLDLPGPIDFTGIDWVIAGGESGPNARPMHVEWARSLRNQTKRDGVPFLFKQWGEYSVHECLADGEIEPPMHMSMKGLKEWRTDLNRFADPALDAMTSEVFKPGAVLALPVGKKAAGRLLDGRTHDEYPTSRALHNAESIA